MANLSAIWIDRVYDRKKPRIITLDTNSSEGPTHGDQAGAVYNTANFMPALALPKEVEHWSLTKLWEKLVKIRIIGAKVVSHGR